MVKAPRITNFFRLSNSPPPPRIGATAPGGLGPPHYRGFTITLRHTTLGRTPLDEWSARRTDLYLTRHNTHKRQTSMPRRVSNPQSQQAIARWLGLASFIYCVKRSISKIRTLNCISGTHATLFTTFVVTQSYYHQNGWKFTHIIFKVSTLLSCVRNICRSESLWVTGQRKKLSLRRLSQTCR
jgi:hypothetical protein